MSKRALFLSVTVGEGHNSASKSAMSYLESIGIECKMLDTYKFLNKFMGNILDKGYSAIGRYTPTLNKKLYDSAKKLSDKSKIKGFFPADFTDVVKSKMAKYLREFDPDIIICTHMFCGILMQQIRQSEMMHRDVPVIGVNTDFCLHPFWEHTDVDYIVVASELLIRECKLRGIPEEKVLPFGIPISEKTHNCLPMVEARKKLGLKDMYTILLIGGGMGFGDIPHEVEDLCTLEEDVQIVVVCGSNKQLKEKILKAEYPNDNIFVLGYINNMGDYMDASDIIYTKPGGLTTSETLVKGKPLILMPPLPGVEQANVAYLVNRSLALITNEYLRASTVIGMFMKDIEKQRQMDEARKKFTKTHSAKALGEFVKEMIR